MSLVRPKNIVLLSEKIIIVHVHADVSISKHRARTQIHSLPEVDQIRGFILYVCWGDNFLTEPANELNLVISEESLSNVLLLLAFP